MPLARLPVRLARFGNSPPAGKTPGALKTRKITIGIGFPPMLQTQPAFQWETRQTFYWSNTNFMSQHSSLRGAGMTGAKRNVLKRYERVELLKKRGQWKTGERVTGLRKTKPEA